MTPPTTGTSREERFFIRKNGAYYRPNSRGYTTSAISAGRYTQEEAEKITHPNGPDGPRDGMSYIAEHICPDEDWQEYRAVCAERDALRDQLAAARNETLEEAARVVDIEYEMHKDYRNASLLCNNDEDAQCRLISMTTCASISAAIDALKDTTPAPLFVSSRSIQMDAPSEDWQEHADKASAIIRGSAQREVTVQEDGK